MYYKDKHRFRTKNYEMEIFFGQLKGHIRPYKRYTFLIISLLSFYYFYKLLSYDYQYEIAENQLLSSNNRIINNQGIINVNDLNARDSLLTKDDSNKRDSSIIIEALMDRDEWKPKTLVSEYKNGIYIYDLVSPVESWWSFECLETQMKQSINTKICIHDPKLDKYISGQLKENGLWEPTNVRSFIRQLIETPEANVMDIGANIGLYTMIASKMNHSVIAVEPLHENLNRLHKAARMEGVERRIVALVNAISNQREQIKVSLVESNIGASHVEKLELTNPNEVNFLASSAVIVNSILMDDLVDVYKEKMLNNSNMPGGNK
jgi:FkbM family methyltransferase